MDNYLLDKDFLKQLDLERNKEIFARIISLTFDENPLEQIEGRVTGGSINVDGSSAIRRTCSLTMAAQEVNINEFYWGLSHKFKLEIGLTNTINSDYPDICWFKQGTYIITAFSTSQSATNYSISISGQDKMCLLNGNVGGALPSSIDFGQLETYDTQYDLVTITNPYEFTANTVYEKLVDGTYKLVTHAYDVDDYGNTIDHPTYYTKTVTSTKEKLTLKNIIREAVHQYGKELYSNIIINDLDETGLELLEYRGESPMYILYDVESAEYTNMTMDGTKSCYIVNDDDTVETTATTLSAINYFTDIDLFSAYDGSIITFATTLDNTNAAARKYKVCRLTYGDTAGYRNTDLTYTGDLISSVGETLTSILDKIKNMLSTFEYFYDVEGHFIFQKKRTYTSTSWNSIVNADTNEVEPAVYSSAVTYNFTDGNLITSFNNTPALNNLKNDYIVWGQRTSSTGATIAIHARYAIDKKPTQYVSISITDDEATAMVNAHPDIFTAKHGSREYVQSSTLYSTDEYDWREIIYQMAKDYYKYNQMDNFLIKVAAANSTLYPTGITGYEQYYVDVYSFWREIYDPNPTLVDTGGTGGYYEQVKEYAADSTSYTMAYNWVPYEPNSTTYDFFTKETVRTIGNRQDLLYWNTNVIYEPDKLNFWLEFLDPQESSDTINAQNNLAKYSVSLIGDRPKVVNDTKITSVYAKNTPSVIFTTNEKYTNSLTWSGSLDLEHIDWPFGDYNTYYYKVSSLIPSLDELSNAVMNCESMTINNISAITLQDWLHTMSNSLNPSVGNAKQIYVFNDSTLFNYQPEIIVVTKPQTISLLISKDYTETITFPSSGIYFGYTTSEKRVISLTYNNTTITWDGIRKKSIAEYTQTNLTNSYDTLGICKISNIIFPDDILQGATFINQYDETVECSVVESFATLKTVWNTAGKNLDITSSIDNGLEKIIFAGNYNYPSGLGIAVVQAAQTLTFNGTTEIPINETGTYFVYHVDDDDNVCPHCWKFSYTVDQTKYTIADLENSVVDDTELKYISWNGNRTNYIKKLSFEYYEETISYYCINTQTISLDEIAGSPQISFAKNNSDGPNTIISTGLNIEVLPISTWAALWDASFSSTGDTDDILVLYYDQTTWPVGFIINSLQTLTISMFGATLEFEFESLGIYFYCGSLDFLNAWNQLYYTAAFSYLTPITTISSTGYTTLQIPDSMNNLFTISAQGKNAKDEIDDLLYQYSYCSESVSISSVPIYYLEPNTRIAVHDIKSKIDGEYLVSKFTIPLTYNGTMSITATKVIDRIL